MFSITDEVLMYRENLIGNWVGPFIIEFANKTQVKLDPENRKRVVFVDKVIRNEDPDIN